MRAALTLLLAFALTASGQETYAGSQALDLAVEQVVRGRAIPGAVLLVGRGDKILHRKAYGYRALVPRAERMTVDTIFDIASLTKVVATTPALMQLVEQGRVRLDDPVVRYLPRFQGGEGIQVRHLLTHYSGLRADVDLNPPWSGYETGIDRALAEKPLTPPGESFTYSDINFILLCEIIRTVSGEPLDEYTQTRIFEPLGMRDTRYKPPEAWRRRIAPTEIPDGQKQPLRGVVHDDTTRFMGGVSGHAGVFSTADDLARFARMMLGGGALGRVRIAGAPVVARFTMPNSPADKEDVRGLGWDIDSRYSSNRGDLFPIGSYGHTGFTGTSLWIDPSTKTYVILLANSVHPKRGFSLVQLRRKVATIAAKYAGIVSKGILTGYNDRAAAVPKLERETLSGLETAAATGFAMFKGQRVGLITNNTGIDRRGRRNVDLMLAAGVNVVALLSPEHGLNGQENSENVADTQDDVSGLPVWSLYRGNTRRPPGGALANLDVLVFDMQDIGTRFYTYVCTMLYAMEEVGKRGIPFVVLDRPNPIGGVRVEGPMLEPELQSFTGCYPLPLRHGMTLGEIATMANEERKLNAKLTVVRLSGWRRLDWFDQTGLLWVNPSPNMRNLKAAALYPGVAMLEYSKNYSVGRGTTSPFEMVGAEWINGVKFAQYLNRRRIPGLKFSPVIFRPVSDPLKGKKVQGVRLVVSDPTAIDAGLLGLELATGLQRLYPNQIDWNINERLIGNRTWIREVSAGKDPAQVQAVLRSSLDEFLQLRRKYLLY